MDQARTHANNFNLIRLLAALQVLIVHAINHFEITGFGLDVFKAIPGVPTFFLISGYLIGASYQRRGWAGIGQFSKNRFLRIFPGLWVCVLVSTAAMLATGYLNGKGVSPLSFGSWLLGQSTVVQFYNPEFMRQFGTGVLNGALWTISVELQFYVLVPLLFTLLKKHKFAFAALFAVSLGVNLLLRLDPDNHTMMRKLLSVTFLPWVYMFMLGFLAAYYQAVLARVRTIPYALLIGAYLFAMLIIGNYKENASNAINPVAVVLLGALILKFGTARIGLPAGAERFIQRSDFSYGLYLYHMPVINILLYTALFPAAVNVALAIATTAGVAIVSWFLIEQPALSRKLAPAA
ncbi:MAG: acyltransferase [Pseudomonadota bacterium]